MADVASNLKSWSATASSNSPAGTTNIGTQLDDNLREIQAVVRQDLATKGADIASATTTDLGAVAGLFHDITGTTTITSFGTVSAGIWKIIKFEGALTLTHNATSLILPGGANITTADGDIAIMFSEGSGNWRCVNYVKASVAPPSVSAVAASDSVAGVIEYAIQSEMESASSTTLAVTPGRVKYHPAVAKWWVSFQGSDGTVVASHNVDSVTRHGTGEYTVTVTTDISGSEYAVFATATSSSNTANNAFAVSVLSSGQAAGTCRVFCNRSSGALDSDPVRVNVFAFGDFA